MNTLNMKQIHITQEFKLTDGRNAESIRQTTSTM